jgi:hypothetical protein
MDEEKLSRQQRRARKRVRDKLGQDDEMWDRPITREGADLLARQKDYYLKGFIDIEHPERFIEPPDELGRYVAVFVSLDPEGPIYIADGRTMNRALRRGLALCGLTSEELAVIVSEKS